jgi:hypothetical protein
MPIVAATSTTLHRTCSESGGNGVPPSRATVHIVAIQSRVRRDHSNPPIYLLSLFDERTASAYHFDTPQAILGREKLKSLPKPGLPAPGHALPPPEMLT